MGVASARRNINQLNATAVSRLVSGIALNRCLPVYRQIFCRYLALGEALLNQRKWYNETQERMPFDSCAHDLSRPVAYRIGLSQLRTALPEIRDFLGL